jgi:hypothetical protein
MTTNTDARIQELEDELVNLQKENNSLRVLLMRVRDADNDLPEPLRRAIEEAVR